MDNPLVVLDRFPENLIAYFVQLNDALSVSEEYSLRGDPRTHCINIPTSINAFIFPILNVEPDEIVRFRISKGASVPHIDSKRQAAIQIPIHADYERSRCYYAKNQDLNRLVPHKRKTVTHADGITRVIQRWDYQEHFFNHYDYRKPFVLNTKHPHGGFVKGDVDTVMISLSFNHLPYPELCRMIKHLV